MILTCPQCATRYFLSAQTLGPEGRRVKCTSCKEVWFQIPDPDEVINPADIDMVGPEVEDEDEGRSKIRIEEIPNSVKPKPEDHAAPESGMLPEEMRRMAGGYGVGAAVFAFILVLLLSMHQPIVRAWPESVAFYNMFGMKTELPGTGLVFDQVAARALPTPQGEEVSLKGSVINLTRESKNIPMIQADLRDDKGAILDSWIVALTQAMVDAEATLPFESGHKTDHPGAKELNVRFVLREPALKTAEAGGENTPAPHQDGQTHPSADEAASESHEHGSAPSHQESEPSSPEAGHSDHPLPEAAPEDHNPSAHH